MRAEVEAAGSSMACDDEQLSVRSGSPTSVEIVAEELGPSLRWATATPVKAIRSASDSRKVPSQRRLMSMSQTSDRVTGGPSSGCSTQVPSTVP
jgi:hypothetical protein